MNHDSKARVIAFYLPQFHPIPENDRWWGKGFTEWTNVGKARKYFRGHYQPRVPADLGYYDLRLPEVRQAQADMAREYGVEAFCYWEYWFGGGKRLLEKPLEEVLASGRPDFPFCLGWANHSWKGFAGGKTHRNLLIEQRYPGDDDHIAHFNALLSAFRDKRYLRVEGRLLFLIFEPHSIPDAGAFIELWQRLARENGLPRIYFVAHKRHYNDPWSTQEYLDKGFDRILYLQLSEYLHRLPKLKKSWNRLCSAFWGRPQCSRYENFVAHPSHDIGRDPRFIPSLLPDWDHSPRTGREGDVLVGSTPELFERQARRVFDSVADVPAEERLVILKSWNEWGESNYMEPDLKWGRQYLEALRNALFQ